MEKRKQLDNNREVNDERVPLPAEVVLTGWHFSYIGYRQDLLVDGLPRSISCCHGDGCRCFIHALELT